MGKFNSQHYIIQLKDHGDERGGLAVIEEYKDFPFQIKRVFYIYNTEYNVIRGNHANRNSRFGFVSLKGSCCVEVDDGYEKVEYQLDSPLRVLFVEKMIWKTMKKFSEDNLLLVISDQKYDSEEYIVKYEDFRSLIERRLI